MELTKEKIHGIAGSILFYIVLLIILYFTFLRTEIKAKEEGVLVNFGSVNLAAGTFTPKGEAPEAAKQEAPPTPPSEEIPKIQQPKPQIRPDIQPKPQAKPQSKPQANPTPPPITQNLEQTAAIEAAKQKQREKAEAERAAKAEQTRREQAAKAEQARLAEEQRKRDAINRQVSGAFGASSSNPNGKTDLEIQGNPQDVPATAPSGSGYGEFNLGGRSLGAGGLPRPDYSAQEEGFIVVEILVDPHGNVISALAGKGTTINSKAMRNSAEEAAKRAKFNSIAGNNNQQGTITYKYTLK
jgi:TonB family protein